MSDEKLLQYDLLLGGKWVTSRDPLMLKEGDFSVLTNMRYTDTNPISIGGMQLVNTSGLNETDTITAAYQFVKTQPDESHVLIQRKIWTAGSITDSCLEEITSPTIGGSPGAIATTNLYDDGVTLGALTDTAQFSPAPNNAMIYLNGDKSLMWMGTRNTVGKFINATDDITTASMSAVYYDYTDIINYDNGKTVTLVEHSDNKIYMYIMATAPLSGVYFDVGTVNSTDSTMTAFYYEAGWQAVSALSDGTSASSKSLAKDGYVTWTKPTQTQHVINGINGYWYKIIVSASPGTTTLNRVYGKYEIQPMHNLWDGEDQACLSAIFFDNSGDKYKDYTTNVSQVDFRHVGDMFYKHTYLNIDPITAADFLYLGFMNRQQAIRFVLPEDQTNATDATMKIEYWNGAAWTELTIFDGTFDNNGTLNKSGLVSWNSPADNVEFPKSINNGPELYYYRVSTSGGIDGGSKVDYISGIPTLIDLPAYKTSTLWKNRIVMGNNLEGQGNALLIGASNTNCVFNGKDAVKLYIDDSSEIQKLVSVPVKFANGIEDVLLIIKRDKTYTIVGETPETYKYVKVSDQYGIVSPSTLALCEYSESQSNIYRPVAIWLSPSGVVMYDAGVVRPIDGDIENIFLDTFNTTVTNRISFTYAYKSSGWYDSLHKEYHLLYPDGYSAANRSEIVYDLSRQKWYKIDRGSLDLLYGTQFRDSNGMPIQYGFLAGKYYRLDYGTAFDTDAIVSQFTISDKPFTKSISSESVLRYIRLNGAAVTTTTGTPVITLTHYGDSKTTGTSLGTKSAAASGYRLYNNIWQTNKKANIHSLNFSFSNAYNLYHFQPLIVSVSYFGDRMEVRSS